MEAPKITFKACDSTNYRKGVNKQNKFIVIHYTANNGDTAWGNANYFANNKSLKASAHYFVDESEFWQSVKDGDIAYHCGATNYKHLECRNGNSIGIEICSRKNANGVYYFKPEAVVNAITLTQWLMSKYNIPVDNVIRHYDVTGKNCPAPFVQDASQWALFKTKLTERVIDVALETWQKQGGQNALKFLAEKGLVNNIENWNSEEELAKAVPAYLFWMLMARLAEYKGGK